MLVGVYIPPQANAATATSHLADLIHTIETSHPDSQILVLGDFNHAKLTKVLPEYRQQIKRATREGKTLDHCYCTISEAYHAVPRAPLGFQDHSTVFLLPYYMSKFKSEKPSVHYVKRWDAASVEALRDCLECTDWRVLCDPYQNIHEYTNEVTSCIRFCEEVCIATRRVKVFPNNKPWFTPGVRAKLKS